MKKLLLSNLFFSILTITLNAQNWKTIETSTYRHECPNEWMIDESKQFGTEYIFFSPIENEHDNFSENFNLIIEDLSKSKITLDEYASLSENQIKKLITQSNIISNQKKTDKKIPYYEIIYTGKQGQLKLKWKQRYWINHNKAYILTFTSEQDRYDIYITLADQIFETFVLSE